MMVEELIDAYQEEITRWDFYSDSQRAFLDSDNKIVVCLRNYDWYITKEPITDLMTAAKALIEITWISEFDDDDSYYPFINSSKYWRRRYE